jgi:BirA family biotin operon repressor/biotin-[acetyl-CoA-carboxylase] ligase
VANTRDLDPGRVHELLRERGCPWPAPLYVESTGSTNADALDAAGRGIAEGTCFVAGEQTAGRGRRERTWVSDPGAGLWCSTVLPAALEPTRAPIAAALAIVDVARELAGPRLSIKWPNDVLAPDGRKIAGILAEAAPAVVVAGIGINVDYPADALPDPRATSWFVETGEHPDRSALLAGLLTHLHSRTSQPFERVLEDYRSCSSTVGARVRVLLPDGAELTGIAQDVDESGHLLVQTGETLRTVIAGDVIHATIQR